VNHLRGAQGGTPFYLCLPLIWGAAGGDLLDPLYSWDRIWIRRKRKQVFKTLKIDGLASKEIPTRDPPVGRPEAEAQH
jgi:hypothetical protein